MQKQSLKLVKIPFQKIRAHYLSTVLSVPNWDFRLFSFGFLSNYSLNLQTAREKLNTKYMRRVFTFISVLLLVQIAAFAQLPSVIVGTSNGGKIDTAKLLDGKTPLVISFWSVTCKPCIQELDAINEALEDWQEEADFKVIAVSTDDTRFSSKAKALAEGHGWDGFTVVYDVNSDFKRAMNVVFTPHSFVLSPDGTIVHSQTGYNPGAEEEILSALKKLQ